MPEKIIGIREFSNGMISRSAKGLLTRDARSIELQHEVIGPAKRWYFIC
jgi:hypothetical protein